MLFVLRPDVTKIFNIEPFDSASDLDFEVKRRWPGCPIGICLRLDGLRLIGWVFKNENSIVEYYRNPDATMEQLFNAMFVGVGQPSELKKAINEVWSDSGMQNLVLTGEPAWHTPYGTRY